MCARLLRPRRRAHARAGSARWSERVFGGMLAATAAASRWALRHGVVVMLVAAGDRLPQRLPLRRSCPRASSRSRTPGALIGNIQADQSISFQAMRQKLADFMTIVRADPAVENVVGFTGGGAAQLGAHVRRAEAARRAQACRPTRSSRGCAASSRTSRAPTCSCVPVQDIRIGGRQANAQYQYTLQADDLAELRAWEPRIRAALSAAARAGRRQHRPAGQGPADLAGHRPRRRVAARRHAAHDRRDAERRCSASARCRRSTTRSTSTAW